MSDLVDLQQAVESLLQECEYRLSAVEKRKRTATGTTESQTVNQAANSKTRSKNRAANQAALEQLIEAYPQTFSRENVRPLKIGIQEDLIADEKLARNRIKRALATYVRSLAYLRSVQEGVERVDLKGEAAGLVTASEAEHAQAKIKEIQAQRRERQKEQREQEQQQRKREKDERLSRKLEALVNLKGR
ncbi:ProQ/FINO family protein [Marinobacterium sediminicola]|uniref:ProP effector n=1 Tax=Marinobacterium sediminicola TaxID=518898 RepID=A0ABY1RVY5_9GAMM|nr:ProQ/FinO family protein [Marinobacterium sediminicola]ULG70590.1 ProQ/FinO family protein [Marinobacterium sediminicola]SMR68925.1 ProP effector [Marinobacterium sediminicola]